MALKALSSYRSSLIANFLYYVLSAAFIIKSLKLNKMRKFKTKIEGSDSEKEFDFECYENDTPIEIGDKYIFFFAGIADVQICDSESIKSEVNKHDRPYKTDCIDLVHNFWRNCYKIKSTNFDLSTVS